MEKEFIIENPLPPSKNIKYLFSGMVTSLISRLPALPIERVIIIQQANDSRKFSTEKKKIKLTISQILKTLYKREGIRGILKGNGINSYKLGIYLTLELYFFEILKQKFRKTKKTYFTQYIQELCAGGIAGASSFFISYPLEFARTMSCLNKTPQNISSYQLMQYCYNKHGFLNLYKGSIITCSQFIPYAGYKYAFFGLFQRMTQRHFEKKKLSSFDNFMCGGMAGVTALLLTYPMDVIGKQRMIQILNNDTKKFSYTKLCRKIYRKHGIRGFYYGTGANVYKCFIICSVAFMINDHFKVMFEVDKY